MDIASEDLAKISAEFFSFDNDLLQPRNWDNDPRNWATAIETECWQILNALYGKQQSSHTTLPVLCW